ncbi:class I SAM-dependent methyltransferase [Caulobacter sp. ErkDOM-E]|uniref:class I SAM-dependent methyltransferase n=1 Tax=Caulobacter sp. ErkDOM-E TaxID=3402778 RepID=UPI003AF84496
MTRALDINDLDGQAHEIWRLGNELCGDCGTYHKLRGVLLKAGGLHGGRHDTETLKPFFQRLTFPGVRILIAGSADAGLLRTVLDCAEARPLAITILDLCPTPLALIDRLQPIPDVSISTQVADLTQPLEIGGFDLIVSHSMLPFVPWERRGLVLDSLRSALAPGGRLVVSASVGDGMTADSRRTARQAWLGKVLKAVDDLPEMATLLGEAKQELLRDYTERFRYTDDAFATVEQIAGLLEAHGLEIDEQGYGSDRPAVGVATPGRRSAIFVSHARTV